MNPSLVIAHKREIFFHITLNRPEKCNAYDHNMALQIKQAFMAASTSESKAIILSANGNHFCSGADLTWMKAARNLTANENIEDMRAIKNMFETILHCPLPIIGFLHGAARAGGVGLVSCCDFAFAKKDSSFALTEQKWGLIPGIITPIVTRKIGKTNFDKLNDEAALLDNDSAKIMGLISDEYTSNEESLNSIDQKVCSQKVQERLLFANELDRSHTLEDLMKLSAETRLRARF